MTKITEQHYLSLVFIFFLGLFLHSAAPSVYWYDEGELITALANTGLPHSPSFPLYVNAVKPATYLPFGSLAFRANITSGIFSALTLIVLLKIMMRVLFSPSNRNHLLPYRYFLLMVPLFFLAFTDIWWYQSIRAEVYTFNALISACVVYLLLKMKSSAKNLLATFFFFGLGLSNHPLLFIHIFPGCLIYLIYSFFKQLRKPEIWPGIILFTIIGLSIYLYLPVRSSLNPIPDLGDPENLSGFLLSFFRKRSFGKFFGNDPAQFITSFRIFLGRYLEQFTIMGAVFIIIGLMNLLKRKSKEASLISLIILVNLALALMNRNFTDNPDTMDAYFLNLYQFSCIFLGAGFLWTLSKIYQISKSQHSKTIYGLRYFLLFTALLILTFNWVKRYPDNVLRNDDFPRKFGKTILDLALPNAMIITGFYTNTHFILMELNFVERYRNDAAIIDRFAILHWHRYQNYLKARYPYLAHPILYLTNANQLAQKQYLNELLQDREQLYKILTQYTSFLVEYNLETHPTYWMSSDDDYLFFKRLVPKGPLFQIVPTNINRFTQDDWIQDEKIYEIMKIQYLDHPNFHRNNTALQMIGTQFSNMAITLQKSGFEQFSELESNRAKQILGHVIK